MNAYEDGYSAYNCFLPRSDNPHLPDSREWRAWFDGWDNAECDEDDEDDEDYWMDDDFDDD